MKPIQSSPEREQSASEELFNAVSHGVGIFLSVAGLVVLGASASEKSLPALIVYSTTLVLLYTASTLYHLATGVRWKRVLRKLDHIGIFLLIAGTYTPFCVLALTGSVGTILLSAVWLLAATGLAFKLFLTGKYERLSLVLYLSLGWLVVFVLEPVYHAIPALSFLLLLAGGVFYSAGIIFYRMTALRFHHGIWHLFVVAGSVSHFLSVYMLLPR